MTLTQMINRVRRTLPGATTESISDAIITEELNIAVDKVNLLTKVYKGYTDLTLTIDKQLYSLVADVSSSYLGREKSGVIYYNSSSDSDSLIPKTRRWLDLHIPNWRDQDSAEPQYYWIDGDELGFYPKPSAANTARIHYLKKATAMDNGSNYPWMNLSTGCGVLEAMDDAIIGHAVWKLAPALGKTKEEIATYKAEFLLAAALGKRQINRAPDLSSDGDYTLEIDA